MIVDRRFIGPILRGEKTQLRRPVVAAGCPLDVGKSYAVQTWQAGPAGNAVPTEAKCRITVVETYVGLLHETSDDDARAEGFADRGECFAWWRLRYGDGPGTPEHPVEIPVWVVVFQLDRQIPPKFLARGRGDGRGYVTVGSSLSDVSRRRDVVDELEVVPDSDLEGFAARALQTDLSRVAEAERVQEARPLSDRVADLERAQRMGQNVAPALGRIRRCVQTAEARLRRDGS